jgi:hypothetical protein
MSVLRFKAHTRSRLFDTRQRKKVPSRPQLLLDWLLIVPAFATGMIARAAMAALHRFGRVNREAVAAVFAGFESMSAPLDCW